MATVNLGRVGLVLKGDWDSATAYVPLDVVSHDGNSWAAKRNNTNVEPTTENSDDWQLISNNSDLVATVQGYKEDAETAAGAAAQSASDAATSAQSITKVIAPTEESSTASAAYAVGEHFIYNGKLYIVTAAIAQGGTITPGTNCEEAPDGLSGEVSELKSAIDNIGNPPNQLESDAENVDLDVTDENGNVILRLEAGHIKTKEFDSSTIEADGDTYVNPTDAESVDLDVSDIQGNVVLRLKDGHIKTKKFDSTDFVPDNANPLSIIKNTFDYAGCFLNVGCIGDSLASGAASSNDGGTVVVHDFKDQSWGQYLARMTGNKYYNFSQGGLTAKSWLSSTYATQAFDGSHDCEAYIIGLGENDYSQGLTIGTSADINLSDYTQNADTFYGNYGGIIQRVQEHEPKAKIFVIVNPRSYLETAGYNAAIRAMATIFDNVYVIDLYTYGGIVANGSFLRQQERNGHFNALGYKYCAKVIGTYIDWIIANNLTDFKTIELIGTEWSYT